MTAAEFIYYTPCPEQFIAGFKFEVYTSSKTWIELEFEEGMFSRREILELIMDDREQVRAKQLK